MRTSPDHYIPNDKESDKKPIIPDLPFSPEAYLDILNNTIKGLKAMRLKYSSNSEEYHLIARLTAELLVKRFDQINQPEDDFLEKIRDVHQSYELLKTQVDDQHK